MTAGVATLVVFSGHGDRGGEPWGEILLVDEVAYRDFAQANGLDDSAYNLVSGVQGVEEYGWGTVSEAAEVAENLEVELRET
jgi:hypothetical protein